MNIDLILTFYHLLPRLIQINRTNEICAFIFRIFKLSKIFLQFSLNFQINRSFFFCKKVEEISISKLANFANVNQQVQNTLAIRVSVLFTTARNFFTFFYIHCGGFRSGRLCRLNWNTLKGNQPPIQKFERPNRKMPKSKNFLTSVKNWCPQLPLKPNEAISPKIWIESKQIQTNEN